MTLRAAARHADLRRTLIRELFEAAPPEALNLGLGQPDLVTPDAIREAGVQAIREGWTGYPPTAGYPELRRAVAGRYRGFAPGPEGVVVTVGAEGALFVALLTLLDPGDEVLVPDPGFPSYPTAVRLAGGVPVPYRLRAEADFEIEPAVLAERIGPRTRVVILCTPSNPTGAVERDATLRDLTRLAEEQGLVWLSDEIYDAFVYERPHVSPSHVAQRGVVVSGLSKSLCMTGWRVGWLVTSDAELAAKATAVQQYLLTCGCSISQRAALAAFDERGEDSRRRIIERFRHRRDLLQAELERRAGLRASPPRGAFYLFVDVRGRGESLLLARRILDEAGVVTIPGEAFGPGGAGWLRLSYAAADDVLVEAARRIGGVLGRAGPAPPDPGPQSSSGGGGS